MILHNENNYDVKQDNSIYSQQACGGPSLAPLLKTTVGA